MRSKAHNFSEPPFATGVAGSGYRQTHAPNVKCNDVYQDLFLPFTHGMLEPPRKLNTDVQISGSFQI